MSRAGFLLAMIASLALAAAGCGREAEQVEWKTSETLPEKFPKDVPIYPNAKVVKVVYGKGAVIVWHSPDPVATVKDFYVRELQAKGWKVTVTPGVAVPWLGEGGVTVMATGWNRQFGISLGEIGEQGEKTAITIALSDV